MKSTHSAAGASSRTREERQSAGRALRNRVSRTAQASWKPSGSRADPVDLLIQSSKDRLPHLLPIRYGRMMQSPFAFYRGAAAIMAADLAPSPASGIQVQACGDCHLMNFAGFATPERRIVFDINDFDETLAAPWEWDVKRLAASFVIAAQHGGGSKADARDLVMHCGGSYRERMHEYAAMGVLERWYARIDAGDLLETLRANKKWRRWIEGHVDKAESRSVREHDFPKLTTGKDGQVRIKDNPPLIFHQTETGATDFHRMVKGAFHRYRSTLIDERRALLDRYEVKDVAAKVVGVGSVGTRCGIVLLMAGHDDPLFLQVKEARESVLEPHAGKSRFSHHGERVVRGQRLMQAASDLFLGWTDDGKRQFYVRQLRDMKVEPPVDAIAPRQLDRYADWCGWALARAHAKTGDAAMIAGYMGKSDRFDRALTKFAFSYAAQNAHDHQALLKAVRAGRIPASKG